MEETLLLLPPEALALADEPAGEAPALETPVLLPVDLSRSHGHDITPERIAELAASYDPAVETASLNFDHAFGGPSYGDCERVWVQDGMLWVRFVNLAQEVIEGIRSRRYTRRSAEITVEHRATGGWYFTALALLGNARPAVPGLPPLTLRSRVVVITGAEPHEERTMEPQQAPPATPAATEPLQLSEDELRRLRAGVETADRLRLRNAELEADQAITKLGARVTPAMRKDLRPLLVHLLAQESPATLRLTVREGSQDVEREVPQSEVLLRILGNVPAFEALGRGAIAAEDPAELRPDGRTLREVQLHERHGIDDKRYRDLKQKYNF